MSGSGRGQGRTPQGLQRRKRTERAAQPGSSRGARRWEGPGGRKTPGERACRDVLARPRDTSWGRGGGAAPVPTSWADQRKGKCRQPRLGGFSSVKPGNVFLRAEAGDGPEGVLRVSTGGPARHTAQRHRKPRPQSGPHAAHPEGQDLDAAPGPV